MVKYIALFVVAAVSYFAWTNYPETHGPGIMADEQPKISRLSWQKPFEYKGANLIPKKIIEGKVRIIQRKKYYFDNYKEFAPVDAFVGWEEMSDERNLDFIHFDLSNRSYEIDLSRPPLDPDIIYLESDLWHLMPSNKKIKEKLNKLRNGNVVRVKGLLVDLDMKNNSKWKTQISLKEGQKHTHYIIWLEEFTVL